MNVPIERMRRVHVIQGEYQVSCEPDIVMSTILGSCVSACVRDPVAQVGGMNHFLLPGDETDVHAPDTERYGVHLMELLVNGLMRLGANRDRLEAKLFGGARVVRGLSDIGKKNSEFAERYMRYEGIRIVGKDLGGERGRRLEFWPLSGRARQSYVAVTRAEPQSSVRRVASQPTVGDFELF